MKAYSPTEYDQEPVVYCSKCYSLKIKHDDSIDSDYCEKCGCTDVQSASIYAWERMYEARYGHRYVVKNTDPRKSTIFQMSVEELKKKVFTHPLMDEIIKTLYPRFPGGLTDEERVIVLFDKLFKDSRLDDLRYLLLQYS